MQVRREASGMRGRVAPALAMSARRRAREGFVLPGVKIKENETFDTALKRFKKQVEKAGVMYELRRREYYEKPSVRRKKKAVAARKRALKKLRQTG